MSVQVVVMTHPARAEMLAGLLARLDVWTLTAVDPQPDEPGCWECAKAAWLLGHQAASAHVAVIQDDVLPVRDFQRTLQRIVKAKPSCILALYANSRAIELGAAAGKRFVAVDGVWGQGILMPRRWIKSFIAWGDEAWKHPAGALAGAYYDTRLGAWAKAHGYPIQATVPSLLDHLAPSDSLLGYNNRTRTARVFPGEHISGLTYDWSAA